ncbi:hypothetical protein [Flavobacterium sp. N2270]|uniref:hypothetical protein n=1 Tax=Flavobacterium sp. N2270 TaxID=2986831 RepID=UPI0022249CF8|nr:hypothetical protein [Flavobacterium sp. N2270]
MKKFVLLFLFCITLLSCTEKEKTYEELESEVLCDVLPQLAHEFVMTKLPPPPPPEKDYEKYNYKPLSTEDFIKFVENRKDSIKILANEKHKINVGINLHMFSIKSKDFELRNKLKIDSLIERRYKNNELVKSTLKFKYFEPDSLRLKGEFINDKDIAALISTSRVLFNSEMKEAYFKLYPFGCLPTKFKIISEKKNNKWVVKEIIEE